MHERGGGLRADWEALFARYAERYPEQAEALNHMQRRTLLQAKFGFTVENIVAAARNQLGLQHDTDTPGVTLETSETVET